MRHDYDLPPDWESMGPEERDQWFHQERCRRQSKRQSEAGLRAHRQMSKMRMRIRRRNRAKGFEELREKR
jgi:hypothetical protein